MKLLSTIFLLLFCVTAIAQDRIIKINKEIINCKVTELAAEQVKYYYPDNPKLIFGIDNALVEKIEFGTGEVIKIETNSFKNADYYAHQSKNALKVKFLSPLFGTTEFAFERNIKPGRSWEAAIGLVGLGNDIYDQDPAGFYGKFAYKMMRSPDYYQHRMHYAHILKGAYFAPEIAVRYMKYDGESWDYIYDIHGSDRSHYTYDRESQLTVALMLKLGKQWVFDDGFLLDIYAGVGYGFGADDDEALPYGFLVAPEDFPIALTSGIRLGWVFGK